nr:gustatory receptor 66a [Apolygus lucorum]
MMMVANQFMGLVKHVDLSLSCLLKQLKSPDQTPSKELLKSYHQLYDVSKLIDDAFSLQNLILIIHHVFATTFSMYYFFEAIMHLYPSSSVKKRIWLNLATYILYFSCICLKFALCQTVQSKAKDFKETLYDKIFNDSQEAQTLALRPLYKKIKFSAFDVLDMDFKALKAIIMTIVTYQVILLQFTVSNPSTDKKDFHNNSSSLEQNRSRS